MKRITMMIICGLVIVSITGCNSAKIDQLNDQVIQLEQENLRLKEEIAGLQEENRWKNEKIQDLEIQLQELMKTGDVSITDIQIISDEMYKDKDRKGKIYGKFDVVVKLKNNSQQEIHDLKVAAKMETSIRHYPKSLSTVTSKLKVIKSLKAGEEKEFIFEGFQADHPETVQELIVNIIDHNEIKKIRIFSAFSPNSED